MWNRFWLDVYIYNGILVSLLEIASFKSVCTDTFKTSHYK